MGIFDRLGTVINSYFNDFAGDTASRLKSSGYYNRGDPDFDAAYDELNDFLNGEDGRSEKKQNEYFWQDSGQRKSAAANLPPEELRADFDLLGVPFGADDETCKAAYKKLLKIHHPDRHAGHEGNYKKATEKSAKINAAWDRIERWHQINAPQNGKK